MVIAFPASADLVANVDTAAAREGISPDVARRAVLRDLRRKEVTHD
jgi:hypothetical protein